MKPHGSWFFDGYKAVLEPKKNGKGTRRVLVYVGEYYGFAQGEALQKKLKRQSLLLSLGLLLSYLLAQLFPTSAGRIHWVAIPSLLSLLPAMFLLMGLYNFLTAKEKWEIRVYYSGYRRLYRSAVAQLVLLCCWAAVTVGVLLAYRLSLAENLPYLALCLISVGCCACLERLLRRNPAIVVQGPTVE